MEASDKEQLEVECQKIVLWRHPFQTIYYFLLQLLTEILNLFSLVFRHKLLLLITVMWMAMVTVVVHLDGPHQNFISLVQGQVWWCLYWVGLGVLSSVGLGTGLHTFLLYLGPHIASVTMAAWECSSTKFPEPPYPNEIVCPEAGVPMAMSLWLIMSKIRLESFMWGAGTALGELPPYFMARAARLSGRSIDDDDDLKELEEIGDQSDLSIWQRLKLCMHSLVHKAGFIGILLCASIPNPLFDLAGITCGHFLVPFTTFFGATFIGKAVIKMHIQMLFVILIFTKHHLEAIEQLVESIPYIGPVIHAPFVEYMEKQKIKLHSRGEKGGGSSSSMISALYEKLVIAMIAYFVVSIVNSMAQQKFRELKKNGTEKTNKEQ